MSFLAPLFLIGSAAIIGPILFHLIRRAPQRKKEFSTLMFLEPDPPEFSRRSRVSNWLLLLLRCLVILLLCLAFSRPFFRADEKTEQTDGDTLYHMIVVDTSASMQRDGIEDAISRELERTIKSLEPSDLVALGVFHSDFNVIADWQPASTAQLKSQFMLALQQSRSGFGATNLGHALTSAADRISDKLTEEAGGTTTVSGRISLVSDFQKGANLNGIQGYDWHSSLTVNLISVSEDAPPNSGIAVLGSDSPGTLRLQILNDEESLEDQFQITLNNGSATGIENEKLKSYQLPVASGSSRIINVPLGELGVSRGMASFVSGDSVGYDNQVYWVNANVGSFHLTAKNLGSSNDSKSLSFFLHRAFGDASQSVISIRELAESDPVPEESKFLVIAGIESEDDFSSLAERVASGLDVLWLPRSSAELEAGTRNMLGYEARDPKIREIKSRKMELLAELDWDHPVFAPFDDPQFNNFSGLGFYRYLGMDPDLVEASGGHVMASFEDGTPWLSEFQTGTDGEGGKIWVMTSAWEPGESLLARSSKFIPIMLSIAKSAGAWQSSVPQYYVGQPWRPFPTDVTLTLPDGSKTVLEAGTVFAGVNSPGFVDVSTGELEYSIPVNVDPRESMCSPTALAQMQNFGIPSGGDILPSEDEDVSKSEELTITQKDRDIEQSQKGWKWIVALVMVLAILETLVAGLTGRRAAAAPTPST